MRHASIAVLVLATALPLSCKRGGGDRGDTPPVTLPPVAGVPVTVKDAQARLTHSQRLTPGTPLHAGGGDKNAISVSWINDGVVEAKHSVGAGFVCQFGELSMKTRRAWIANAAGGNDMSASSEPYSLVAGAPSACEVSFAYGKSVYDAGEVELPPAKELGTLCWKPGTLAVGTCSADRVKRTPRGKDGVTIEKLLTKTGTTAKGGHAVSAHFLVTANAIPADGARVNGWVTCTGASGDAKTAQMQMLTEIDHLAAGETMEAFGPAFVDAPLADAPATCEVVLKLGGPGVDGTEIGTWCWRGGAAEPVAGACG